MATQVNKKFLIITIACLLALVVGVVALAAHFKLRSAERNITQAVALTEKAEAAQASGDTEAAHKHLEDAMDQFGRAVNKDGSRRDYLEQYIEALLRTTPQDEVSYNDRYRGHYFQALTRLAGLDPTNPELAMRLVESRYEFVQEIGSVEAYASIVTLTDERLKYLKNQMDDPLVAKIRGYRGLSQIRRMFSTVVREDQRQTAFEDVQAAYAEHPDWHEAGLGLVQWHLAEREIQKDNGRLDLADLHFERAVEATDAFLADHPNDVLAQLIRIGLPLSKEAENAQSPGARSVIEAERSKQVAEIFREVEAGQAGQLDFDAIVALLPQVGEEIPLEEQAALMGREASLHLDDPKWLLAWGQALQRAGQRDEALDKFQRVLDLPMPSLSLEGMRLNQRRREAANARTTVWLSEYARATTPEERQEALTEARKARDDLNARLGARGERLLRLVDARLAIIDQRWAEAEALLSELRSEVGDDPQVRSLLATVLMARGTLGGAREILEGLAEEGYRPTVTLPQLADVYVRTGEPELALISLDQSLEYTPDNETLQNKRREVQTYLIATGTGGIEDLGDDVDPIVQKLMEIRQAEIDGESDNVARLLEEAYAEFPGDRRIIQRMVQLRLLQENTLGAIEIMDAALDRYPDDTNLKLLRVALDYEDPREAEEQMIKAAALQPAEEALQLAGLHARYGEKERVWEQLDIAEEADPNHPSVLEAVFAWSLTDGDLARARSTAQRAASVNADRADGATFQGRLEIAEGRPEDAVRTFERATERLPHNAVLWRFLGHACLDAGQVTQAIDALARAMQTKPDDIAAAKLYAQSLVNLGRENDALAVVGRDALVHRFVSSDAELRALWLALEARVGDRAEAVRVRRSLWDRVPEDTDNAIALAALLIEDEAFQEANTILQALEGSGASPLLMTRLKAQVATGEGSFEDGNAVFERYAESLTDNQLLVAARLAQAGFLVEAGEEDRGIAILESARSLQGDERRVDAQAGNYFFARAGAVAQEGAQHEAAGRIEMAEELYDEARVLNERAIEAYRNVASSEGAPDRLAISRRLVEALMRLDDLEGAQEALSVAEAQMPDDLEVLVLKAALAERNGNVREAQRALGRAVELYPSSHLPFYRRALLNRSDPGMFPDVIQDLDQVIKLRPDLMDAWALKFSLYQERGRVEDSFAELRKGIEEASSASGDTMRRVLVQQLLSNGRESEALAEVVQAAERYPNDPFWQASAGDLCARLGQHTEAARAFQRLFDLHREQGDELRTSAVATLLLDSLLRRDAPPTRGQVLRLLDEFQVEDDNVPAICLRARSHAFLNELDETEALFDRAYELALGNPAMLGFWYTQVRLAYGSEGQAQAQLEKIKASKGELPPTLQIRQLGYKRLVGGVTEQDIDLARTLVDATASSEAAQLEAYKLLSNIQYDLGKFEDALASAQAGLAISDRDLELNNNAGYILAKHLGRGEEAIPYAEQAQRIAPGNSAVLDTVGVVFLEGGRVEDALRVLQNAERSARTPDHRVLSLVHMAEAYIALEDSRSARQALEDAERELRDVRMESNRQQYQAEIDQVRARIP